MRAASQIISVLGTANTPPVNLPRPVQLFVENDVGDVDGMSALYGILTAHIAGDCNLIGYAVQGFEIYGAPCVAGVMSHQGVTGVPISATTGAASNTSSFAQGVAQTFSTPGDVASNYIDNIVNYRTRLAAASDNSVVIFIGCPLTNLKTFMQSAADGISSLTGMQLLTQKVRRIVMMDGSNWPADGPAANWVFSNMPSTTEVVVHPASVGATVYSGPPASGPASPLQLAFDLWDAANPGVLVGGKRSSYDGLAALYAIYGNVYQGSQTFNYTLVNGTITVDNAGNITTSTMRGKDSIVGKAMSDAALGNILDATIATIAANDTFQSETTALIARFSNQPTELRKFYINSVFQALKAASALSSLDFLYLTAAADAQAAQQNWLANQYNLSPVNSPTFTADRGYAGDSTTSYLTTGFVPSTNGVNFTQNSASFGLYINAGTDTAADVNAGGGFDGTSGTFLRPRSVGDGIGGRLNQSISQSANAAVTTRKGLTVLERNSSTNVDAYRNGSLKASFTQASAARTAATLWLCAINNAGVFNSGVDNRIAAAFGGAALGATKQAAVNNAILRYLIAVGGN